METKIKKRLAEYLKDEFAEEFKQYFQHAETLTYSEIEAPAYRSGKLGAFVRPNVRANRGSEGRTPWPDSRECTVAAGGPRWPAVAAPVERGVRAHLVQAYLDDEAWL